MKKLVSFLLTGAMVFSMAGCSKNAEAGEQEKIIPVKVMEAKEENYPILLEYLGNTNSEDIIKYSFKVPGKIAQISVKEGEYVKQGQVIAVLDNQDYNFAVDGARGQMEAAKGKVSMAQAQADAAKAQYDKAMNGAQKEDINNARLAVKNAENNYNYAKESHGRAEKLYKEGIVSKQQLDDIKIKLDGAKVALDSSKEVLSKAENGARAEDKESALAVYNGAKAQYEAAQSQYEAATTQYEAKQSMLKDTVLKSGISGYVVKVLNKAGENTAAGYPVVVIRTEEQVIDIQIAQNDIQRITTGTKASIKINDIETEGVVTEIEQTPDVKSRTYKAKIKMNKRIPQDKFYVGSVSKVNIKLENKKGIWLPITTILNDGEDYVYVVDKDRISRKNIIIKSIYGDKVLIDGVSLSDKIVTEGLKNIKPGYKVKVVK
ncbi:efflux RND transporter periplasmic adaptor subunit [Clostridium ganghwense]|uniref:Efflux RND transporter periplasmic adaptor subunit n=1 Tax=Clostridium ganghwense TaxID=312089 RepID=A0ABT4CSD2_9CLOT|nr:efflux RND transporter periplasmic adaptor subunit [Clostridium ganghwense]MCY6370981.1 efflux RND transporter periplasmic adaptor subunit [Clostridium ganghwense]